MASWELRLCDGLRTSRFPALLPAGATLFSRKLVLPRRGFKHVAKREHARDDMERVYQRCLGVAMPPAPGRCLRWLSCYEIEGMHNKRIGASAGKDLQDTKGDTNNLLGRVVAFTTPTEYAHRLEEVLTSAGAIPLWCPTIVVESTPATRHEVMSSLWGSSRSPKAQDEQSGSSIQGFKGIAFTSRAGIRAFAEALHGNPLALSETGGPFILAALGRDMDLLQELSLCSKNSRITYLAPSVATPASLVEALGPGRKQRLLCPVPLVQDLQEPHVVPSFLQALSQGGWQPVRVNAYVTRWAGAHSTQLLLTPGLSHARLACDALVFTSTAEVEGILKGLQIAAEDFNRLTKECVVAAHGPVTADGAARLGVKVDVVGSKFHSFAGVVGALSQYFECTAV